MRNPNYRTALLAGNTVTLFDATVTVFSQSVVLPHQELTLAQQEQIALAGHKILNARHWAVTPLSLVPVKERILKVIAKARIYCVQLHQQGGGYEVTAAEIFDIPLVGYRSTIKKTAIYARSFPTHQEAVNWVELQNPSVQPRTITIKP